MRSDGGIASDTVGAHHHHCQERPHASEGDVPFRLVGSDWQGELDACLDNDSSVIRIVCPFVKAGVVADLLAGRDRYEGAVKVLTRFDKAAFARGVSDTAALRLLLERGARIRGIRRLHAKVYLFGRHQAIVTSANLTHAALNSNHEFGFVATDGGIVRECRRYFADLWKQAGDDLTVDRIDAWDDEIEPYVIRGGRPGDLHGLGDDGVDIGLPPDPPMTPPAVEATSQAS